MLFIRINDALKLPVLSKNNNSDGLDLKLGFSPFSNSSDAPSYLVNLSYEKENFCSGKN